MPPSPRQPCRSTPLSALLELKHVHRRFEGRRPSLFGPRSQVQAVSDVSLSVEPGQTLGLVGESGCGKSTLARLATGLLAPSEGTVWFDGIETNNRNARERRKLARQSQLIVQDTSSALNPRLQIGSQVAEMLEIHGVGTPQERVDGSVAALKAVGLDQSYYTRYPHQLSGGQLQRAVIARALVLRPQLVVCDEPVSSLDVSVRAQVINLLTDLRDEFRLTYLFVSHDLSVVKHISDTVAVMYLGEIVEKAPRGELFESPHHPYTRALLDAIPVPDPRVKREHFKLAGDPPSPLNPPAGCRFHTRCPLAMEICSRVHPRTRSIGPAHAVACHLGDESGPQAS